MSFRVGQKVICVHDQNWPGPYSYTPIVPKRGVVYTIRSIIDCRRYGYDEEGLLLVEIVNPIRAHVSPKGSHRSEVKFRASRFRPVHSASIEVFHQLLEPEPVRKVRETVDA